MFYVFDVDPDGNLRLAGCEPESPELLIADLLPREVLEIERVADKTAVDADPADKALLLFAGTGLRGRGIVSLLNQVDSLRSNTARGS